MQTDAGGDRDGGEGYFGYGVAATEQYVETCEAAFKPDDLVSAQRLVDALSELAPCYRDRSDDLERVLARLEQVSQQFPNDPWIKMYLAGVARGKDTDWKDYRESRSR